MVLANGTWTNLKLQTKILNRNKFLPLQNGPKKTWITMNSKRTCTEKSKAKFIKLQPSSTEVWLNLLTITQINPCLNAKSSHKKLCTHRKRTCSKQFSMRTKDLTLWSNSCKHPNTWGPKTNVVLTNQQTMLNGSVTWTGLECAMTLRKAKNLSDLK